MQGTPFVGVARKDVLPTRIPFRRAHRSYKASYRDVGPTQPRFSNKISGVVIDVPS